MKAEFLTTREAEPRRKNLIMEEPQEMQDQPMKQEEQIQSGGGGSAEGQRIAELEAQLVQAKQEAGENWNRYLRERAEMDNFRKRQERLSADRVAREKKMLLSKVLEVMDNVER